jgi:hypothetical protein
VQRLLDIRSPYVENGAVMQMPDEIRKFFQKQGGIGGKRRAKNLSPAERSESARKAVQARWKKAKKQKREKSR